LRSGLRERGWIEGKNLVIEAPSGGRAPGDRTAEFVRQKVDLIVAQGGSVFGARAAAGAIPMVFGINGDPVEAGLVASLSHPGGNLTGITALSAELAGKRLELLKEAVPGIARVAVIANMVHPGVQIELRESQRAAQRLGLTLQWVLVYAVGDFDAAFDAIVREGAQALVAIPDALINRQAKSIAEFSAMRRIPAVSGWAEFAEAGNLMSYGPNLRGFYRHMAVYADKLLRGARPADLPVEQPTAFAFVINLKTAKALGLTIPPSVLLRADQLIE
jgi:putative ABC transport system substrate-binding protein